MFCLFSFHFFFKFRSDPLALLLGEPRGLMRPIRQIEDRDDPEEDCGESFQDEEPAPSCEAEPVDSQQQSRNWGAYEIGNRLRDREHGKRSRPILRPHPVTEIDNNSRKETCFRHS